MVYDVSYHMEKLIRVLVRLVHDQRGKDKISFWGGGGGELGGENWHY